MARAVTTYNSPDCVCGQDHDQLSHIVAAILIGIERGEIDDLQIDHPWDVGDAVAQTAHRVGWVKAGDELEDLRILTNGMAGFDSPDTPKLPTFRDSLETGDQYRAGVLSGEIPPPGMYGIAVNQEEDLLMIAQVPEEPHDPADIIMTIALNPAFRMSLAAQLLATIDPDDWDDYQDALEAQLDDGEDDY